MKIFISGDQISFFERFGYVELESVFSKTLMQKLSSGIMSELEIRKRSFPERSELCTKRDLALSSKSVRGLLCSSSLARCVFDLVRQKPLRYGYDQFLQGFFPGQSLPLPQSVCVGPIVLNALICIRPPTCSTRVSPIRRTLATPPLTEGGITFFSSTTTLLPTEDFGGEYILVGYGGAYLLYRHEEKDPCCHSLKQYGYTIHDALKQSTHPIVW